MADPLFPGREDDDDLDLSTLVNLIAAEEGIDVATPPSAEALPPPMRADVDPSFAEALPPSRADAMPGPADRRELPPPIPIPTRQSVAPPPEGSQRARRASGILNTLLKPLTGIDQNEINRQRQEKQGEQAYQDALRDYAMKRDQRKESLGMLPVRPEILDAFGLQGDWTREDFERWRNAGGGSLARVGRQHEYRKEEDVERSKLRLGELEQKNKYAIQQIIERAKHRAQLAGTANPIYSPGDKDAMAKMFAASAGVSVEEARDGIEDIIYGEPENASKLLLAGADKRLKPVLGMMMSAGGRKQRDVGRSSQEISRWFEENADATASMRKWDSFIASNPNLLEKAVVVMRTLPMNQWGKKEHDLLAKVRAPAAAFLRKMAGAAMSAGEANLHGGLAAKLLVDDSGKDWLSAEGIAQRLASYVKEQNLRPEDFLNLIDRVRSEIGDGMRAKIRDAPNAALNAMPEVERKEELFRRLRWAGQHKKLKRPEKGAEILPESWWLDGHRIRFKWKLPDGTTKDDHYSGS